MSYSGSAVVIPYDEKNKENNGVAYGYENRAIPLLREDRKDPYIKERIDLHLPPGNFVSDFRYRSPRLTTIYILALCWLSRYIQACETFIHVSFHLYQVYLLVHGGTTGSEKLIFISSQMAVSLVQGLLCQLWPRQFSRKLSPSIISLSQ